MTTIPDPTTDPVEQEPTVDEVQIRNAAMQYASIVTAKETPVSDYLHTASLIEAYLRTGDTPKRNKDN